MKNKGTREFAEIAKRVKANQRKLEKDLMDLTEYYHPDDFVTESLWKMSDRMKTDREFIRNAVK